MEKWLSAYKSCSTSIAETGQ